jgi:hypothetical protein
MLEEFTPPCVGQAQEHFCVRICCCAPNNFLRSTIRKSNVATGHTALFQIALMILLGRIEFAGGSDFRRDRVLEFFAGLKIALGFFRDGFLLR